MGHLYSTRDLNVNEQFDYWREELCHIFVELEPERSTSGKFHGSIYQQPLTDVTVSRVTADAHGINRTQTEINQSSEECFFANLQLQGIGKTHLGREEIVTKSGDLVLIDARRPYHIQHQDKFELISIKIPCFLLGNEIKLKNNKPLTYVPFERGYASLLKAYTTSILDDLDTSVIDTASLLAENLVSLISISLYASDNNLHSNTLARHQYSRLQELIGYISCHIKNPTLNINLIARHFSLSPRYIQKLFYATGTTFSEFVLQSRLEKCAIYLSSQQNRKTKISEIAMELGFNDFSYFSRAFKKKFGVTPREYKKTYQ